jgi:hypothetical protein
VRGPPASINLHETRCKYEQGGIALVLKFSMVCIPVAGGISTASGYTGTRVYGMLQDLGSGHSKLGRAAPTRRLIRVRSMLGSGRLALYSWAFNFGDLNGLGAWNRAADALKILRDFGEAAAGAIGVAHGIDIASAGLRRLVFAAQASTLMRQAPQVASLSRKVAGTADVNKSSAAPGVVGTEACTSAALAQAATAPEAAPIRAAPQVRATDFGGYRATWTGDSRALAAFEPQGTGVYVSDIFRGARPKGSAGAMLADALRGAGIDRPSTIRITGIIHKPTLAQLAVGAPAADTVLGRTLANAAREMGGTITGWATGVTREKPWIEATMAYSHSFQTRPGPA